MDKPIVFTDFHHAGLLNSLIMLFEGRLGGKLYRPIGMEWQTEGYWHVYPHPETAKQYLEIGSTPADKTPPLNNIAFDGSQNDLENGFYLCQDIDSGQTNKAITLQAFKSMEFDIVIASIPQHIEPFKKLIKLYQPKAKLIYQIGNQWNVEPGSVQNVMASARVDFPEGVHGIIYHQEFSLDTFYYEPVKPTKKIYSFINVLQDKPKDWELFLQLEKLMPDWEFKSFGGGCRDGAMTGTQAVADKMREATFIFQVKESGDGYGHIIHNAAAVGKPIITRFSDYQGKLAEPLITYPCTSVHVDDPSYSNPGDVAHYINYIYSEGGMYESYSKEIYKRFKKTVDFDAEELEIRQFLATLI